MVSFGVIVPQGWRLDLKGDDKDAGRIVRVAREAERLGYASIWLYDHFITYPEVRHHPVYEAWTTLSYLAGVTSKVRLGTIVTCNLYRYPTVLAKIASTLDVLSGGRLEFGIGACWYWEDFQRFGIPFPPLKQRLEMLDEALQIIKSMWVDKETWFKGKYYRVYGAINYPKPLQKPHPPIMVGGFGEKIMAKIIAKHADKSNFFGTPEEFKRKIAVLEKHCKEIGRDCDEIKKTIAITAAIFESEDELRKFVNELYALGFSIEEFLRNSLTGTPDKIVSKIREYIRAGVEEFIIYFKDVESIKPLEVFAEKVIPLVD